MKIKASSDINNVATQMKDNIDIIGQMIDYLEFAISDTLPNTWIGDDATSFAKKYNESIVELRKYVEIYSAFLYPEESSYSDSVKAYLADLNQLNQTTC